VVFNRAENWDRCSRETNGAVVDVPGGHVAVVGSRNVEGRAVRRRVEVGVDEGGTIRARCAQDATPVLHAVGGPGLDVVSEQADAKASIALESKIGVDNGVHPNGVNRNIESLNGAL